MYLKPRAVVVCLTFLTAVAGSSTAQAQSQALIDKVKAVIAADTPRLEATFKDLHAHPELAFTETRTADIVATALKKLGFTVTTGIGKTGVVGVLKNGPGPTLWYRADMDANGGVRETTGLPWAAMQPQTLADGSEVDVMHACGHDAHITWLLWPAPWPWMIAGFFLFRLFDVWKPWPCSWADRRVKGGFGVMLDDAMAGTYAALVLALLLAFSGLR